MQMKVHDHACVNCFTDKGPCLGECNIQDENKKLNPPRCEMLEYIKAAIGEGYQPEHEAAITDLSVIDGLNDHDLNREFGKCWQWYNMGGGIHETFEKHQH